MRKLLSAGMLRLRKNRLFYLGNAVLFCLGIFFAVGKYFDMQRFQIKQYLDDCLFLHVIFAGCCVSVFCSLFTGTEFSSGTIRNKLIVGQTRRDVYLSDLIVCLLSTLCMTAAFLLSYCSFGLALLLPPQLPWKGIGIYLCISLFTITAYVSIFHMLSMLVSKKTISAVTCLLLFIGLFLLAVNI